MANQDFWPTLHSDPFARKRLKRSCELLQCRNSDSVLDVGCHQEEAREFLRKDLNYFGIDHLNGYDIDGEIKISTKFDRILCLEVLEHLKYPQKTLASIVDLLTDDGIAVISLPNEASLFHRIRSMLGVVDGECFSENGKHLHLPSLSQAKTFISSHLKIQKVEYYISDGCGTQCKLMNNILKMLPKILLQLIANAYPSLFSRGFIFVCAKK